uniref:Uncharacterized protein n=1 Tax=Ganoderma calidophilum TaxID=2026244 RepID=A0A2S1WBJ3_9APHY|nr:hypothetical protein [Ganoderma calidophilum]AWJ63970.1 hypothetical protein [Ganoderma calidophilum]
MLKNNLLFFYQFYSLFDNLCSIIDSTFFILFSSLIIIEGLYYIRYSGAIKKGLKDIGTAIVLGAAAKAGSDLLDSAKEAVKKAYEGDNDTKKENEPSDNGSNNTGDNNSNKENK